MDIEELYTTADLAHIELRADEMDKFKQAVGQMVDFFERMQELDLKEVAWVSHPYIRSNKLRKDSAVPSALADEMLEQAPDLEDRFIVIPNVL